MKPWAAIFGGVEQLAQSCMASRLSQHGAIRGWVVVCDGPIGFG